MYSTVSVTEWFHRVGAHIFNNFVTLRIWNDLRRIRILPVPSSSLINQSARPRVKDPDRGQRPEPEVSGPPGHVQDTQDQPQVCRQSQGMLDHSRGSWNRKTGTTIADY